VQVGERRLLPRVRQAPDGEILVADGFSCRTQIEELTGRRALHTAQVIKMAMTTVPKAYRAGARRRPTRTWWSRVPGLAGEQGPSSAAQSRSAPPWPQAARR
jgi:hypothetical protein